MNLHEFDHYRFDARHIATILRSSSHIVLTTHVRPDGDAIGSLLGLGNALQTLGFNFRMISPSPLPSFLRFLPQSECIEAYDPEQHATVVAESDLIVCLDFNALSRLEKMSTSVAASRARRVAIDHHLEPEDGFAALLHDVDATSTAELVYALLALEFPETLCAAVATPLYTGILTDSGNFRFPRVSGRTHRIVADLIDLGADPVAIYDALYNTNPPQRLRLLGQTLRNLEIVCNNKCAVLTLTRQMFEEAGAIADDTESFVQHTLTIDGVYVGVFLSEMLDRDAIKVSLRSKGQVDVQRIAMHLGGGGHLNAAAAIVDNLSLEQVKERVVELISVELEQMTHPNGTPTGGSQKGRD